MRKIAVVLFLAVLIVALPARAEMTTDLTYDFIDRVEVHSDPGSGFNARYPETSFGNGHATQTGTISLRIHEPKTDGRVPIEISERARDSAPPHHDEIFPKVTIFVLPNGTVDVDRQYDITTTEEGQLAQFLAPNVWRELDGSHRTWKVGGVVDRYEDWTDYTLLANDGPNAVVTFEERVRPGALYNARGKIVYDRARHVPVNAQAELITHDGGGTSIEGLEYTLNAYSVTSK